MMGTHRVRKNTIDSALFVKGKYYESFASTVEAALYDHFEPARGAVKYL